MSFALQGPIVRQTALRRLESTQPRAVMAVAAAGYGKSTLVRQYSQTFANVSVCDFADSRTPLEMARAIVAALAEGDEARQLTLAQLRLTEENSSRWIPLALSWWSEPHREELFVFENLEQISNAVENVEFLSRLLPRTPPERRIAVCSRSVLPFSWHRFFPPHEVQLLRENELRFERGEVDQVFGNALEPHELDAVCEISRGWPIAVLLLARMARDGSLGGVLSRARMVDFESLYDYLSHEVLAQMPPDRFARLVAIAAIPRCSSREAAIATDLPEQDLRDSANASPFVYAVGDDVFEAHPVVREMIRSRYAARCTAVQRRLAEALHMEEPVRAAELFLIAGDHREAVRTLESQAVYVVTDVPRGLAELVERIEPEALLASPALWSSTASVRTASMGNDRWLSETLIVRNHINDATPVAVRFAVLLNLCNVLSNLGRHEEALDAIASITREGETLDDAYQAVLDLFIAGIAARRGRLDEAMERWKTTEARLGDVKVGRAIGYEEINARVARFRGERTAEAIALRTSVTLAAASGAPHIHALALQESIFGAWLAGDDAEFARLLDELDAIVVPSIARATQVFRDCARGNPASLRLAERYEHARIRAYAALIAASCIACDRAELAARAYDAALEANEPLLVALTAIACAETEPHAHERHAQRALAAVSDAQAPRFRSAVAAYAARSKDVDFLEAFLRRLRDRAESGAEPVSPKRVVKILTSVVECSSEQMRLSKRETELVMFLAARGRPCGASDLLDALWDTGDSDQSVLRVYVRRVRAKLGDDAIVSTPSGYALGPHVTTDLKEIEDGLARLRAIRVLDDRERATLERHCERLEQRSQEPALWAWFAPIAVRIEDIAREVCMLLGRDALARGEADRAVAFARRIIAVDPCDEPARELTIQARLSQGDRASALREFRVYRDTLASELGAKPSASLEALVRDSS